MRLELEEQSKRLGDRIINISLNVFVLKAVKVENERDSESETETERERREDSADRPPRAVGR